MRGLWCIPVFVAAAFGVAFFDGDSGLVTWWELRGELRSSDARIATLRAAIDDLEQEAASLESDPAAIERAIREELGLARSGEIVVRLPPADAASHRIP